MLAFYLGETMGKRMRRAADVLNMAQDDEPYTCTSISVGGAIGLRLASSASPRDAVETFVTSLGGQAAAVTGDAKGNSYEGHIPLLSRAVGVGIFVRAAWGDDSDEPLPFTSQSEIGVIRDFADTLTLLGSMPLRDVRIEGLTPVGPNLKLRATAPYGAEEYTRVLLGDRAMPLGPNITPAGYTHLALDCPGMGLIMTAPLPAGN